MEAADFFWCWPEDADMPPRLQVSLRVEANVWVMSTQHADEFWEPRFLSKF